MVGSNIFFPVDILFLYRIQMNVDNEQHDIFTNLLFFYLYMKLCTSILNQN